MTEEEWCACRNPDELLRFLAGQRKRIGTWRGRLSAWFGHPPLMVSDRKLQLFVCGYSRHNWHLFVDERDQKAIEVAELYTDGQSSERELRAAIDLVKRRNKLPDED